MEQEYDTPRVPTMRRVLVKVLVTLSLAAVPLGLAAAPALADTTAPAANPAVVAVTPVHHHHGNHQGCGCMPGNWQGNWQGNGQGNGHGKCHHQNW